MTSKEFIHNSRLADNRKMPFELLKLINYSPVELENKIVADKNLDFRNEVVEDLLPDFSIEDTGLIRLLLEEEIKCDVATQRHDNVYQLCYYLYNLGQPEDVFRIYDAKFNTSNMDTGTVLDREMLYMGQPIKKIIEYVTNELKNKPDLKIKYPYLLQELKNLKRRPDYGSVEEYNKFIKGYFSGHETEEDDHQPQKPWWKFW